MFLLACLFFPQAAFSATPPKTPQSTGAAPAVQKPTAKAAVVKAGREAEPATVSQPETDSPAAPPVEPLNPIVDLARAGAPGLAIRLLESRQPDQEADINAWIDWERARVHILSAQGDWDALIKRLDSTPKKVPDSFYLWSRQELANAYLQKNDGVSARRELVFLQLLAARGAPAATQARWRRMVIQSYLADGRDLDAERAMLRYRQEFGDAGQDWPVLRAQVLLRNGRPQLALAALPKDKSVEVGLLRLLAKLRAGELGAKATWQVVKGLQKKKQLSPATQAALWALRAETANKLKDMSSWALGIERALGQEAMVPPSHPLALTGDALWQVYEKFGQLTANEKRLLIGDDKAWYKATDALFKKSTVRARAMLGLLALKGFTVEQREEAARRLAKSLAASETGQRVLERLYLHSDRYADSDAIPTPVRHRLIDIALARGDIVAASKLVKSLETAPKDGDDFSWRLRRARVLILAGEDRAGGDILTEALVKTGSLDTTQVDRFLQVVFDLQTVKRHDLAVALFERLLSGELHPKQRREILFWMADSKKALGEKEIAAELYLRSAALPGPFVLDQWAQTAKYHAAEVLTDAGLVGDARVIYRTLLRVTKDPTRQAVLRQRLQKLILHDR